MKPETALEVLKIVQTLKAQASFRKILLEAKSRGVVAWDRTLRRYLDLLVHAGVLQVSERDVGSVYPQQLFKQASANAHLWTGLGSLKLHGLNWDIPETQLYQVSTDLEAMVKTRPRIIQGKTRLITGLEDTLIYELKRDAEEQTGTTELAAAVISTRTIDLPYLLRRADRQNIGQTTRLLVRRIMEAFTSLPVNADGRVYLEARAQFLKILRNYNSKGILKLVEKPGKGRDGLETVQALTPDQIVSVAGKQLGIQG